MATRWSWRTGAWSRSSPEAEELLEIRGRDPLHLVRLAWHLGNRHLETEIGPKWLRIRRDHVIADMLEGLGARVTDIAGPFQPEGGAYAAMVSSHHEATSIMAMHHRRASIMAPSDEDASWSPRSSTITGMTITGTATRIRNNEDAEPSRTSRNAGVDPRQTGPEDQRRDRMNDAPQFR